MEIRKAGLDDRGRVSVLFNQYRQFYGKTSRIRECCGFIGQRLEADDSVIFLAVGADGDAAGFTQLYPSFSSVAMARIYILNDLFVAQAHRRRGIASALLARTEAFAREQGAVRLGLATAADNYRAQFLYQGRDWQRDDQFLHYSLSL